MYEVVKGQNQDTDRPCRSLTSCTWQSIAIGKNASFVGMSVEVQVKAEPASFSMLQQQLPDCKGPWLRCLQKGKPSAAVEGACPEPAGISIHAWPEPACFTQLRALELTMSGAL